MYNNDIYILLLSGNYYHGNLLDNLKISIKVENKERKQKKKECKGSSFNGKISICQIER